jgi:hypothetical protein
MTPHDRQHLEDVMPLYINGRASEKDKTFVDTRLTDPEVAAMLSWHQALADKIRHRVESVSDSVGRAGLMAQIRAQQNADLKKHEGWRSWFSLSRWVAPSFQGAAFAALALVVAGQGALLYRQGIHSSDEYSQVRGVSHEPTALSNATAGKTVVLTINFKDETPEQELRFLLISIGANIIRGPGQLGDYDVMIPADRTQAALDELRKSKWVNDVQAPKSNNPTASAPVKSENH